MNKSGGRTPHINYVFIKALQKIHWKGKSVDNLANAEVFLKKERDVYHMLPTHRFVPRPFLCITSPTLNLVIPVSISFELIFLSLAHLQVRASPLFLPHYLNVKMWVSTRPAVAPLRLVLMPRNFFPFFPRVPRLHTVTTFTRVWKSKLLTLVHALLILQYTFKPTIQCLMTTILYLLFFILLMRQNY